MVNSAGNDTIVYPNGQPLWMGYSSNEHPRSSLAPAVTFNAVTNGCNIVLTYNNTTSDTFSLGKIMVGGIRFGQKIKARDFSETGIELDFDHNNVKYTANEISGYYPRNLFSPVMVIRDTVKNYTIGLSMMYPVINYKHNVYEVLNSSDSVLNGRNWTSVFNLNIYKRCSACSIDSVTTYSAAGDLMPGEVRTYTLCIRVVRENNLCESWQQTLLPYKEYFRINYGVAKYNTDRRPINWYPTSNDTCDALNPYGFNGNASFRPDLNGFGPTSRYLINTVCGAWNYERLIIVRPTGKLWKNPQYNFPFKFTSHWLEGNTSLFPRSYGHQMGDAADSLALIPAPNRELGLCWGRATQVMFAWDTSKTTPLNPYNSIIVNRAMNELKLAAQTGANLIALDWFRSGCSTWDGYIWLGMMRDSFPGIKFYTERWGADVLQTMAGMYALDISPNTIKSPHYLADFLLPKSEKMVIVTNATDNTKAKKIAKMNLLNSMGYVVSGYNDTLKNPFLAAESWYTNNPMPDLGIDTTICAGDTIVLNASHKNDSAFLWSTGATTRSIFVTAPGTYFVQTTTTGGCIFYDTVIFQPCVYAAVKQLRQRNFLINVFPNPSDGVTTVKLNKFNIGDEYEIVIYNAIGEVVAQHTIIKTPEFLFPTEGFAKGLYIITVKQFSEIIAVEKLLLK